MLFGILKFSESWYFIFILQTASTKFLCAVWHMFSLLSDLLCFGLCCFGDYCFTVALMSCVSARFLYEVSWSRVQFVQYFICSCFSKLVRGAVQYTHCIRFDAASCSHQVFLPSGVTRHVLDLSARIAARTRCIDGPQQSTVYARYSFSQSQLCLMNSAALSLEHPSLIDQHHELYYLFTARTHHSIILHNNWWRNTNNDNLTTEVLMTTGVCIDKIMPFKNCLHESKVRSEV